MEVLGEPAIAARFTVIIASRLMDATCSTYEFNAASVAEWSYEDEYGVFYTHQVPMLGGMSKVFRVPTADNVN
jgi:hypothetical protein